MMTAASTGNPQKSDDLTTISGIGSARERVLRESLGVRSFQDLATLSVDEIEAQLRAEGQFVSRDEIGRWIAEARELAAAAVKEQPNSPTPGAEWESAATFVVEFQVREEGEERRTRVHHMEEDVDADWPDVEQVQLCRWMLEQLGEPAPESPEQIRAEAQQELERELQEMRTKAQQELEEELEVERNRLQTEIEQELEEQKTEAHEALQQELAEARKKAQQELEEELEAERTRLEQKLEQKLEEQRAEAEQALAQELQQLRAEAREALAPAPKEPAVAEEVEEEVAPAPEPEAPAEVEAVPEPVAVAQPPEITIEEFRVYQPPQAETPRVLGRTGASPEVFRRDIPFSLVASFSVDLTDANELARQGVTYTARFQAREIGTGEVLELGTTGPGKYATGQSTYEARLHDVTLPAGLYQLSAFVLTETIPSGGVYRDVSVLLMA